MIHFDNINNWKEIHYNGNDIKEVYDFQGKVWSKTPPIPPSIDGKFLFVYDGGDTYSGACDSSSYIAHQDVIGSPYPTSALTNVVLGDCLDEINGAFNNCEKLTSVTMTNSVKKIKQNAFGSCTSLSGITLSTSLRELGAYAFYNCYSLKEIDIPSGVTEIGEWALKNCTSLATVTIPSSVTRIAQHAFSSDSNLSGTVASNVTTIGDNAFSDCPLLSGVNLPNVEDIGQFAFYRCSGLTSLEIGSAVTNISFAAFANCSSLESIILHATTPPTLGTYGFFDSTCPIYVPAASVNVYKLATNWSTYASRIFAIPNS